MGKGKQAIALRLVGLAHTSSNIRWYLTTVPRELLSPEQVIQGYRLRWLVELLFPTLTAALRALARELKPSRSRSRVALAMGAVGA